MQYFRPSIKLAFVSKIFVLSIIEWPLKTGFTVVKLIYYLSQGMHKHCRFRADGVFKLVEVRKKAKIRNRYNQVPLILISIRSECT